MAIRKRALSKFALHTFLIVAGLSVAYILSNHQKQLLLAEFKTSQSQVGDLIAKNITGEFSQLVVSLGSLADDLDGSPLFTSDLNRLVSDYNSFDRTNPALKGEWYKEMSHHYNQNKQIIDGIYILTPNGTVLARYPWKENCVGADFSNKDGFKESLELKKPFVAEQSLTFTSNIPAIAVYYPQIKDNKVQFISRAIIHMHDFSKHFLQSLQGYDFAIINSKGTIVAHTTHKLINQMFSNETCVCIPDHCIENRIGLFSSKFTFHMCPDTTNLEGAISKNRIYTYILCLLVAVLTIAGWELFLKRTQLRLEFLEKQQLEEKSRQLARKWQMTFDALDDVIFLTDMSYKIEMANKAALLKLGRNPAGESCYKLFHHANEPIPGCLMHQNIQEGEHRTSELQLEIFDNHWFEVSAYPIYDNTGQQTSSIHIFRDITEKRQSKIALENALEKARLADQFKSEFLANMSHEIRTPLNIIIGFGEILIEHGGLNNTNLKYVSNIISAAQQLLYLINEIIDISKIEAGQLRVDITVEDLQMLLNSIEDQMRTNWHGKSPVRLILDLPVEKEPLLFKTDFNRLSQIIMNLINNAFKFTPQGEIRFGYFREDDHLKFFVSDTGIGIPAGQEKRIFDRFTQLESSQSKQHVGAGLGLAISKKLVGLLWQTLTHERREEIRVESREGLGSTFSFTHPLITAAPKATADISKANITPESGAKILIIEDNNENYEVLQTILEKQGLQVIRAADGASALNLFQTVRDIQVIITDIRLPDIDGCEVTRRIRQYEAEHATPRKPIIAVTANAMPENRDCCISAGCDHFLAKPVSSKDLLATVKHCLRKK